MRVRSLISFLFLCLFVSAEELSYTYLLIFSFALLVILVCKYGILKLKPLRLSWLIIIVIIGLLTGIIKFGIFNRNFIRDFILTLQPIVFIYIGKYAYYLNERKIINFFNIIFSAGFILGIIKIVKVIIFLPTVGFSLRGLRISGNPLSGTVMLCLILMFFYGKKLLTGKVYKFYHLISIVVVLAMLLYGSRTSLIVIVPAFLIKILDLKKLMKNLKPLGVMILVITLILIFVPTDIKNDFLWKISKSLTEIDPNKGIWDWYGINNNWRGYESHLVNNKFAQSSMIVKLFGNGFGSLLYLDGITIKLNGEFYTEIATIHNGFSYLIFKTGLSGVGAYVIYFSGFIVKGIKQFSGDRNKLVVALSVSALTTMAVITGFYNALNTFALSIMLGYCISQTRKDIGEEN